jgi:GAF domain-containing protein
VTSVIEGVGQILGRSQPFDGLLQELCTYLCAQVPHYPWVGIYMIDPEGMLDLKAWAGPAATQHTRIPLGEGICGLAAREARTVLVEDVSKDSRYLVVSFYEGSRLPS